MNINTNSYCVLQSPHTGAAVTLPNGYLSIHLILAKECRYSKVHDGTKAECLKVAYDINHKLFDEQC